MDDIDNVRTSERSGGIETEPFRATDWLQNVVILCGVVEMWERESRDDDLSDASWIQACLNPGVVIGLA